MKIHMVKKGDTLYLLSQKYNVGLDKIIAANPQITDPDKLDIGMKVKIPAEPVTPKPEGILHSHKVQQGDSLWKLSQAWGVSLKDMINANPQLKNPNALLVGETVYIPSQPVQGNTVTGSSTGNVATHEKLSPEGKEYTGVKEEPTPPAPPEPPAPEIPKAVEETPAPTPAPAPLPANPVIPNVMPELEVLPQLPELPEVKPEMAPEKKEQLVPIAEVQPLPEVPTYTMPNLSPEIMPLPVIPNTKSPSVVSPATKSPCGCGKKLHHAPAEHPYAQIPVPVQEVYAVPESSHISGYNHNSGFPGLPEATPYSVSPSYQGQWTEQNHNNYTPNLAPEYQQENAYPVAPAAQVNSPFPPFVADTHMNQQPFISPYSTLPYPPCGCGGHMHNPHYGHPGYSYQDPAWGMYGSYDPYGVQTHMGPNIVPNQPVEYAYQNPYPSQNMVPPSPLGAFGELYPAQGNVGTKKGGREEADLSQSNVSGEEVTEVGGKTKQASAKTGTTKRRTSKSSGKRTSKVSVSSANGRRNSEAEKRNSTKKRRNPWIQS
ncbi:LysM peptidoglycan-binding domain-containing protein [Paenibacillus sp. CC-CFT742]|uniref:LysM peptidoglycan-binding domain-containing protein n=1 Tax=Paenibacillus xylanilyticus TaxID=248903 RepID=UPI002577BBCA|nr:LysM peptidoglycan-binding domain-containing protein [Paenibacillus sp. CC-CFT742]WJH28007.1 LysM peptidoglycan-binding domain-containing protein [Paenibacillus sp. CC-CFT742]